MSSIPLSKEKKIARLILDDIEVDKEVLSKARHGDGASLSEIGDILYERKYYSKALDWYRWGAGNDDAYSQFKIGEMYANGTGVTKYPQVAMAWYQKAHKNGYTEATYAIGHCYLAGILVSPNTKTAIKWFTEAATNGNAAAQRKLFLIYETDYVENDPQSALKWYKNHFQQEDPVSKDDMKTIDEQNECLELEKETTDQKLEIESLKKKLNVIEQQLKTLQLEKSTNEEHLEEEYGHCTDSDETLQS